MKLQRLCEMIREDIAGIEHWPVLFTSYRQQSAGEWEELNGVREPITAVQVEYAEVNEVLLIRDKGRPALSVSSLQQKLSELMPRRSDFMVDCCETPIEVDGGTCRIDLPIVGAGRDEKNQCYLLVYVSSTG